MTPPLTVLKTRPDFIRLRKGTRRSTTSFLLQSLPNDADQIRVGVTVTKKIGNAVVRNRIKRRFRAAARMVMPDAAAPSTDYVLIARPGAVGRSWDGLLDDLRYALLDRPRG